MLGEDPQIALGGPNRQGCNCGEAETSVGEGYEYDLPPPWLGLGLAPGGPWLAGPGE